MVIMKVSSQIDSKIESNKADAIDAIDAICYSVIRLL